MYSTSHLPAGDIQTAALQQIGCSEWCYNSCRVLLIWLTEQCLSELRSFAESKNMTKMCNVTVHKRSVVAPLLCHQCYIYHPCMPLSNLSIRLTRQKARQINTPNTAEHAKSTPPMPACPVIASCDPTLISVPAPIALMVAPCRHVELH